MCSELAEQLEELKCFIHITWVIGLYFYILDYLKWPFCQLGATYKNLFDADQQSGHLT